MLRAVIVDDIDSIRIKNISLINEHCPNVVIMAEANNVKSGVELINKLLPDLVFLDVEMPDGTGFDLLQQLQPINFKVIFITGYQDFAIKAFRFSAIDYLLKPVDPEDLIEAVKKAEESVNNDVFNLKLNNLVSNIERPKDLQKIILKTTEKLYSVNIQDIVRCESDKNYTTFFLLDGEKLLVSNTLKDYETLLIPHGFFRSHQSHLINISYFDYFVKADGGFIVMKDKSQVPLAVRKKEEFLNLLDHL